MIKKFLLLSIFLLSASVCAETFQLNINVEGLENKKGVLIVSLYNKETDYMKKPLHYQFVTMKNQFDGTVSFTDLTPGEYSITIAHDENSNNKVDTNFWGIPTEKVGFSNNVVGSYGPPEYKETLFLLSGTKTLNIILR